VHTNQDSSGARTDARGRLVRHSQGMNPPRRSSPGTLVAIGWTLLACVIASGCAESRPDRPPDVLLIVVDTLRWDRVGQTRADRDTSPSLDRLAASGTRFTRAYATAPWTQPSVASILTGQPPSRHGLTRIAELPDAVETLPERLAEAGYESIGIVSHVLLSRRFGFHQGFDRFTITSALPMHETISSDDVTAHAVKVLDEIASGPEDRRPVFLFVHYFDPHYVYNSHASYTWASGSMGRLKSGEDIDTLRDMAPDLTESERDFVRALYDEEVRHTDDAIGRLLYHLDHQGSSDDTLVILTADHGEELFERGWIGHTRTLHEEVVRGKLSELVAHFAQKPRGEFTLVIEGLPAADAGTPWPWDDVTEEIRRLVAEGQRPKQIAPSLARTTGRPRSEIYARAVSVANEGADS
jgi:hypothetical protein